MKNRLSILAALAIAVLLISAVGVAFAITPINHETAYALWMEDSGGAMSYTWNTGSNHVGDTFTLYFCVNLTGATQVDSWQVEFNWPSFINCTAAHNNVPPAGEDELFAGHALTSSPGPSFDYTHNTCLVSDILAPTTVPGTSASIFSADFKIIAAPTLIHTPLLGVINVTFANGASGNTWFDDNILGTLGFSNAINFPITYSWLAPSTHPYMTVVLSTPPRTTGTGTNASALTWSNIPPSVVGLTFTATVSVTQLDAAWAMDDANFTLAWNSTVIDVLGGAANVTLASGWTGTETFTTSGGYDVLIFKGIYAGSGSGTVPVMTLTFTVLLQENAIVYGPSWFDYSYIWFESQVFSYPGGALAADLATTDPLRSGYVVVPALLTLALPYLEVIPETTIVGPAPSIGTTMTVNVDVYNLTTDWYIVGIQYRLEYDPTILGFVSANEGAFMTNPIWDLYGTFHFSMDMPSGDGEYPVPHVQVFDLLFPNTTNGMYDQTIFPNTVESAPVDPTLTTFTFTVLQQNCFDMANITTTLNIVPFWVPTPADPYTTFIDRNGNYVANQPASNGTVIIEPLNEIDRVIDLFGGAVNDGYGNIVDWTPTYPSTDPLGGSYPAFPAPYGGQGPNAPMDIVFPQSLVYLNAYVSYNYWPVQSKDVGFEVEGPFQHLPNGSYVPLPSEQIWAKFTATTDSNGVASLTYRMPWPCNNPDSITGVWKITATVTVADQVVSDVMMFYYQRLVYITSVTTDMYTYNHEQCIKITVVYQTHSIEWYPALFAIDAVDNLTVPFGFTTFTTLVGGTVFCTWKSYNFTVQICIPKWAYAGIGYIDVSVFDKDPSIGGEALAPAYTPTQIQIWPS